eukprot:14785957-Ditylum_brightwellii.AAC.1
MERSQQQKVKRRKGTLELSTNATILSKRIGEQGSEEDIVHNNSNSNPKKNLKREWEKVMKKPKSTLEACFGSL